MYNVYKNEDVICETCKLTCIKAGAKPVKILDSSVQISAFIEINYANSLTIVHEDDVTEFKSPCQFVVDNNIHFKVTSIVSGKSQYFNDVISAKKFAIKNSHKNIIKFLDDSLAFDKMLINLIDSNVPQNGIFGEYRLTISKGE